MRPRRPRRRQSPAVCWRRRERPRRRGRSARSWASAETSARQRPLPSCVLRCRACGAGSLAETALPMCRRRQRWRWRGWRTRWGQSYRWRFVACSWPTRRPASAPTSRRASPRRPRLAREAGPASTGRRAGRRARWAARRCPSSLQPCWQRGAPDEERRECLRRRLLRQLAGRWPPPRRPSRLRGERAAVSRAGPRPWSGPERLGLRRTRRLGRASSLWQLRRQRTRRLTRTARQLRCAGLQARSCRMQALLPASACKAPNVSRLWPARPHPSQRIRRPQLRPPQPALRQAGLPGAGRPRPRCERRSSTARPACGVPSRDGRAPPKREHPRHLRGRRRRRLRLRSSVLLQRHGRESGRGVRRLRTRARRTLPVLALPPPPQPRQGRLPPLAAGLQALPRRAAARLRGWRARAGCAWRVAAPHRCGGPSAWQWRRRGGAAQGGCSRRGRRPSEGVPEAGRRLCAGKPTGPCRRCP
mmetsp:Transcript_21998/g.83697  ORF Transcript_21998/g.83697 Transcript_21998/m.83697 type:complete len:474 (+) Transcript_21998:1405-2826(+)